MRDSSTVPKRTRTAVPGVNGSKRVVEKYVIKPVKGQPLRNVLDNTAEVIAEVEGDNYR
jgi:hypothetical protein